MTSSDPARRRDGLVLDLDTRAGLCLVRTLSRTGYELTLAARDASASGLRTRHGGPRTGLPEPEHDFEAYADAIVAFVERHPVDVVLPTIDSSVAALHARRDALGRSGSAPAIAAPAALEVALSKDRTLQLAKSLGVPTPRSLRVTSPAEASAALHELGLPAVLKPETSWRSVEDGGERVSPVLVENAGEAARSVEALVRPGAAVLVQEVAPGRRETVKLFRAGDRVVARLAMVVERCWPPLGGSSTMRRTVAPPQDAVAHAERLVAEMGLEGYAEVEFRRSSDGRPLLMEVNPRLSQSLEVAIRAGVDFGRLQLEWARGGRLPDVPAGAVGISVGWLGGDARLVAGALVGSPPPRPRLLSTLRALGRDYVVGRAGVEGLDPRDVRPIAAALAATARGVTRRAARRPSGLRG